MDLDKEKGGLNALGEKCPLSLSTSNKIQRADKELRIGSAFKKITYA